jgi:hypothetical protein
VILFGLSVLLYALRFRREAEPRSCFSTLMFGLILLLCALAAYPIGMIRGAERACSAAIAGNLCGLDGVFLVGPLASDFAIVGIGSVIAILCSMRRPSS